jgi:hypothetical protein
MFDFILIVPGRACKTAIRIFSSLSRSKNKYKQELPVQVVITLHLIYFLLFPSIMLLHVGAQTAKSSQLKPPEEVV